MDEITTVVTVVVIATSFWVLVDAIGIGVKKGQITGLFDMGPAGWFFSCLLLWIVAFPAYLVKRQKLKEINEQDRSGTPVLRSGIAPAPSPPSELKQDLGTEFWQSRTNHPFGHCCQTSKTSCAAWLN